MHSTELISNNLNIHSITYGSLPTHFPPSTDTHPPPHAVFSAIRAPKTRISKKMCIFAVWDNAHTFDIVFENQTDSNEEDAEKSPAAAARRPRDVGKHAGSGLQERRQHVRP